MDNLLEMIPEGFAGQQLHRIPRQALRRIRARSFTKDFVVTDLGFFPPSPGHGVSRPKGTRQWILIFVSSGAGWLQIGSRREDVAAGQILLIPPQQAHSYGASVQDPWSIFWLHFHGEGAASLLRWTGFSKKNCVLTCRSPDRLRGIFRAILSSICHGYHDRALLELSCALINTLALLHNTPLENHRNEALERMETVMEAMRSELSRPRKLQDYASLCSLSVPQFSHLFKQHTGISPMAYLNELRIQRASEFLDATSMSIKAIATELGYEDACYFSRAFRNCTGLSPKQYRSRH